MNTRVKVAWIGVLSAAIAAVIALAGVVFTKKEEPKPSQQPITIYNYNLQTSVPQDNTRSKDVKGRKSAKASTLNDLQSAKDQSRPRTTTSDRKLEPRESAQTPNPGEDRNKSLANRSKQQNRVADDEYDEITKPVMEVK